MARIEFTAADRDPATGRILTQPPVERRLSDLLSTNDEQRTTNDRHPIGRLEIAGVVIGLVIALALFVLFNRPAQEAARPVVQPTMAHATNAPAALPTTAPTATPAPPTATPEPAPTPEPQIIYVPVEQPPCYSVTQNVYDGNRPLGVVTGNSCESQEAAQAVADQLANEMRGNP